MTLCSSLLAKNHSAFILGWRIPSSSCCFNCLTEKMRAAWYFQMSETAYLMTQQHIPEEFNLQQHHYENLKSQKCTLGLLRKPLFLVCIGWRSAVQSCLVWWTRDWLTACECQLTLILVSWQEMFHLFWRQILLWRKSTPWQKEKKLSLLKQFKPRKLRNIQQQQQQQQEQQQQQTNSLQVSHWRNTIILVTNN